MLKKASIPWNARQLSKMIEKGSIVFDSAVQRGLVWDDKRKSFLIHSMLEGYPIPAMYAVKENGLYSFIDGKQRSNCINDYLNDKFVLSDIQDVTMEDDTLVDINGKVFSELDEELQDRINTYSLTIHYFEDITDDEIAELFYRLNNGKALTSIELSRSRSKSLETIQQIGKHELFTTALTDKAFERYTHEDLVIKSYIMITESNPCLDTKFVRPIMETAQFSDDIILTLNNIYDRILASYKIITSDADKSKEKIALDKKIAKRILVRTHMLSIIPICKRSIDEEMSVELFSEWISQFFAGTKSPTIYEEYNTKATSGSGHAESVRSRLNVITKDYEKFIQKIKNKSDEHSEE